jgi:hypothetical protein
MATQTHTGIIKLASITDKSKVGKFRGHLFTAKESMKNRALSVQGQIKFEKVSLKSERRSYFLQNTSIDDMIRVLW